jgi:hypothetical protein
VGKGLQPPIFRRRTVGGGQEAKDVAAYKVAALADQFTLHLAVSVLGCHRRGLHLHKRNCFCLRKRRVAEGYDCSKTITPVYPPLCPLTLSVMVLSFFWTSTKKTSPRDECVSGGHAAIMALRSSLLICVAGDEGRQMRQHAVPGNRIYMGHGMAARTQKLAFLPLQRMPSAQSSTSTLPRWGP